MLDLVEAAIIDKWRGHHKLLGHGGSRPLLDNFEQDLRHVSTEILFHLVGDPLAELHCITKLFHHDPTGVFNPRNRLFLVERDEPRADVDCGSLRDDPVFNERELGGSAAHVYVQDHLMLALGQIYSATAVGSEQSLVVVTRRCANEFAGVFREEFNNGLSVFLLERLAGDDHRARVDVFRRQAGLFIGILNKLIDLVRIDLRRRQVRSQLNRGTIEHLPIGDFELARERCALAPQRDMRKNQMGGGRADINAHALEREHLQSFDVRDNLTFLYFEVFRMVVIVNVVVHETASRSADFLDFFLCPITGIPALACRDSVFQLIGGA